MSFYCVHLSTRMHSSLLISVCKGYNVWPHWIPSTRIMTGRLLQSILKLFLKRKGLLHITLRDGSSEAFETWFTRILSVTKKKLLNEEKSLTDIQYSTASVKLQGGNAQTSKEVKLSSIVVSTSAYSANVYGKVIIIVRSSTSIAPKVSFETNQ